MRILFSIIILTLILTAPYWIYLPAIIVCVVLMPFYAEAIIFGLLIDVWYGRPGAWPLGFPFGVTAALFVIFAQPLREHLRFRHV